jgi:hypothetical protein
VTITYSNRIVLKAIVLSHEENEIRAIASGCPDVLVFYRIHGTWISEELEPVTIEFAWQRHRVTPTGSEADCVCPAELAARMIQLLFTEFEPGDGGPDTIHVFNAEDSRVALHRTELQTTWSRESGAAKVD